MKTNQYKKFLIKNQDRDYAWLSKKTGRTPETVRKSYSSLGLPPKRITTQNQKKTAEKMVEEDIFLKLYKDKERTKDEKYQIALDRAERAEKALDSIMLLKNNKSSHKIISSSSNISEATAFMVASDWHLEERVTKGQVSGVNEYTLDIAKNRAEKFFINGVRLIKIFQKDTKIDTLVLSILGDLISGNLHEDSQERNQLGAMQSISFAQELFVSGIKYILENTNCKITIVCHSGNHGRISKKIHWGNENMSSLEWLMYCNLSDIFKNEKRCTFIIPEGDTSYLDVYNMKIRMIHGHQVKFGGGMGGITIPMRKAIAQWDRVQQADLTIFGHFHQRIDGGNFIGNGSLIGYNAYAQAMKCEFESPAQQFFLISNKNGGMKTVVSPIWLD